MTVDTVTPALRRLTRAVWVLTTLVALLTVLLIAVAWIVVRSFWAVPVVSTAGFPAQTTMTEPAETRQPYQYNDFHDWPTERKVAEASAIILTASQGEAGAARDVIIEVVKHAPGVEFHYKAGDVYDPGWSRRDRAEGGAPVMRHTGQIVFLVDSPARMAYAVSYETDTGRCSSMGGISIDQLRELARQTTQVQRTG